MPNRARTQKTGPQRAAMAVDDLWNIAMCSKFLCLKEKTLYAMVAKREIPFFRLNQTRGIRFKPLELQAWLTERAVKPIEITRLTG